MPQLSNINWLSILSNDDGRYFVALVIFVLAILIIGFAELFLHKNMRPGLTTWAIAIPGFIGGVVIIGMDAGYHPAFRILLVALWCLVVLGLFRFAYVAAQTKRKKDQAIGNS